METDQSMDLGPDDTVEDGPDRAIDAVDHLLDEVEAALRRLDDGTYGTCRSCAGVIEDSRLAGIPTAQECAACAVETSGAPVPAWSDDGAEQWPTVSGPAEPATPGVAPAAE